MSTEISNVKFCKVVGDDNEEILEKYDISAFPTFALFKNGKEIDRKYGKMNEGDLKKFIKDNA